jgi:hypothetical protein
MIAKKLKFIEFTFIDAYTSKTDIYMLAFFISASQ